MTGQPVDATSIARWAVGHGAGWQADEQVRTWCDATRSGEAGWTVALDADPVTTGRVRAVYVAAWTIGEEDNGQSWWAWLPTAAVDGPRDLVAARAVLAVLAGRATGVPDQSTSEVLRERVAVLLGARGLL